MVARSNGNARNMDIRRSGGSERDSLNSSSSQLSNHKGFCLPDGVSIPASIDPSMLSRDILDFLKPLPAARINAAFEQYDHQIKLKGDEIRNKRAYLRGILKSPDGGRRYGLPHGVIIPPSITPAMLEDRDLIDILKNMSPRDTNSCFRDYDEQIRKKSGMIRNKTAYLVGIIKSGPHYSLPQGVVLPSSVSLASLQGELLETIQRLPSAHINIAFQEYDEQIQKKGDSIRNKSGYLLGIMKRMKKRFEEEASEHVAFQRQQLASQDLSNPLSSPSRDESSRQSHYPNSETPDSSPTKSENSIFVPSELNLKPGEHQRETLSFVTESPVKVSNELVTERNARNELEELITHEKSRNEEMNQRITKLTSDLSREKVHRERSELELERLKRDVAFERSLRQAAEEKVSLMEQGISSTEWQEQKSLDADDAQLQKLGMELSIERGLREKTEKLLQSAEKRISELNQELHFVQEQIHEERTKSPFGSWMSTSPLAMPINEQYDEDKKTPEIPPSLSGISGLVSLTDFDPTSFSFIAEEDSHLMDDIRRDFATNSRLTSELKVVASAYDQCEIFVTNGEITRYLRLEASQNSEWIHVNLTLRIPSGYPVEGAIHIEAVIADDSNCSSATRKCVEECLPSLIDACRHEAECCQGNEAILSVLTTADYWVQIDWLDTQAKLSMNGTRSTNVANEILVCQLLLETTRIDDVLFLKHITSKHGVGGYVLAGGSGRSCILLEGLEERCDKCLRSLNAIALETSMTEQGESKWTKLSVVGKSVRRVPDLKSGTSLPKKLTLLCSSDAIENLKDACAQVGLAASFKKIFR